MKILFDHQIFSSQRFGGISAYHVHLMENLPKYGVECDLGLYFSNNFHLQKIRKTPHFFAGRTFRGKNRLLELINRRAMLRKLHTGSFDLLHPTFYNPYFLTESGGRDFVFTCHDMIHDRLELPASAAERKNKYALAAASRLIITPSQSTADELMERYNVKAEKIRVVHHGAPEAASGTERFSRGEEFLFVGSRKYYKNFAVLLNALALDRSLRAVCAGERFSAEEIKIFNELGISNQIRCAEFPDAEALTKLYCTSAALIFPSRYEGFGLPVLEAFAAGCPAILSDIEVFHEVAEDAALYFYPDNAAELVSKMHEVLACPGAIRSAMQTRLKHFSWDKCAAETAEVYREALNGR